METNKEMRRMYISGNEIKEGDHVIYQGRLKEDQTNIGNWDVYAWKNPKGSLGWNRSSKGGPLEVALETRWNTTNWFMVDRPGPKYNEFGEVSP